MESLEAAGKNLFRGVVWSVLMRWSIRLIGFINIVILARLLTPEDFGIVAMATIVLGFLASSVDIGAQSLLIRQNNPSIDDINAAWTIKVIQGLLIAIAMVCVSSSVANYFNDPRVVSLINVLAISSIVSGFSNIGMTLARKELDFVLDYKLNVYNRIAGFFCTLALVLHFRSYWGLVLGTVVTSFFEVYFSYKMHPYRPSLSLTRVRPFIKFGYSIVPIRIARFVNQKMDSIIVGGIGSAETLGFYNIASDFSKMMSSELALPLARGIYPGLSKAANNPKQLAISFRNILAATSILVIPMGVGLALVAEPLIVFVFGEKWIDASRYLPWLAVAGVFVSLSRLMTTNILIVAGLEMRSAKVAWLNLLILAPVLIVAGKIGGAYLIAVVSPFVSLISLIFSAIVLTVSIPIKLCEIVSAMYRPVFATILMTAIIIIFRTETVFPLTVNLILIFLICIFTYFSALVMLWVAAQMPDGVEKSVLLNIWPRLYHRE